MFVVVFTENKTRQRKYDWRDPYTTNNMVQTLVVAWHPKFTFKRRCFDFLLPVVPGDPNFPSLSITDLDSGNLPDDVKNKINISQYKINIQSELDFSSKSITRFLMFSFHIHFLLIYFVLFDVPSGIMRSENHRECSMFRVDGRVENLRNTCRVLTKSDSANDFLKDPAF